MEISIDIKESDSVIIHRILKAMVEDINAAIRRALPNILTDLQETIRTVIKLSPTYQALIGGSLAGEFGFYAGAEDKRVTAIVDKIVDHIRIKFTGFKIHGQNITNKLYIYILRSDFSEILSSPEAVVITEKGESLPWLEWLLTLGNRIAIVGYKSILLTGEGRSGRGVMIEGDGFFWRVPPRYSGTIRKNWLTKALNDNIQFIDAQFTRAFKTEIEKAF